jgi:hypothetical protein
MIEANTHYIYVMGVAAGEAAVAGAHEGIDNPPYPSREGIKIGASFGAGIAYGVMDSVGQVRSASETLATAMMFSPTGSIMSGAWSAAQRAGAAGGGGNRLTVQFNINVHGVSDPSLARTVGEQVGEGAMDALTRRGVSVTARMGA